MVPRLVPEISSLDAFCDGAGGGGGAAGIGDSRSLICNLPIHASILSTPGQSLTDSSSGSLRNGEESRLYNS